MILTKKQHEDLMEYAKMFIPMAEQERRNRNCDFDRVFRSLHGDVDYEQDIADSRRAEAAEKGLLTAVPDQLLRFGDAKLWELANDIVGVIMPVDTPYNGVAEEEHSDQIKKIISVCRTFSHNLGHRSNMIQCVYEILAVQHAIFHGEFKGEGERPDENAFAGAQMDYICTYSAFWDKDLPLRRVAASGAVMGFHRRVSSMEIFMKAERIDDYSLPPKPDTKIKKGARDDKKFIASPRCIEGDYRKDKRDGNKDFVGNKYEPSLYDMVTSFGEDFLEGEGLIETVMYLRVPEKVLKSDLGSIVTFRIECVDGYLTHIEPWREAQVPFPLYGTNLHLDKDHHQRRSYGEHAADMNLMLSALMNLTKRAMRRQAVGGTTFLDKRLTDHDFEENPINEATTVIPVKAPPSANGERPLSSYIFNTGSSATPLNMADIANFTELFSQSIFPQSSRADLVNLDRATAMGASLAAQSADSTLMALAIMIDDMIGVPWRRMLKHLMINNSAQIKLVDSQAQEFISLDLASLKELEFEFTTSQPIAGFDRNRVMQAIQVVMNMLIQTPQVSENPARIQKLIDYFLEVATAGTIDLKSMEIQDFQGTEVTPPAGLAPQAQPQENTNGTIPPQV